MAITHVAAATSGSTTNTTSLTITIPACQADDVLIAAFTNRNATANPSVSDNEGAGSWAAVRANTTGASVYWKRASANTGGKTITASGFTGSCAGGVSIYRGVTRRSGNPFANVSEESNISGNETHAGFTPAANDAAVVLCTFQRTNDIAVSSQSSTNPGTLDERFDHLNTGGSDCAVALASGFQTTAAATGNLTWSQTNAASISIAFSLTADIDQGVGAASGAGAAAAVGAASVAAVGAASGAGAASAVGRDANKIERIAVGALATAVSSTSLNVPYPAGIQDGDLLVMHIGSNPGTAVDPTTPGGWDLQAGGSANVGEHFVYSTEADGTETGNLTVTVPSNGQGFFGYMVLFRGTAGKPWSFESISLTSGNDTSIEMSTVSASGANRYAAAFIFTSQVNANFASATGESGGDWVADFEFDDATGTPASLGMQSSQIPSAGSISGGSITIGTNRWGLITFAIYQPSDSVAEGVAEAAGTGSAAAVGTGVVSAAGASAGTGAASAAGTGINVAAGSAAGTGAASATGAALQTATASASGAGTATATGASTAAAAASAAGAGAAAGTGSSTAASVGAAAGIGAAAATGIASFAAVGAASGSGTAAGIGAGIAAAEGAAAATGEALGVSDVEDCPEGVTFDGTNDYLTRGADLSGISDGPTGSVSLWVKFAESGRTQEILSGGLRFRFRKRGDDVIEVQLFDSDDNPLVTFLSATTYPTSDWLNVLVSWDTNHSAGNKLAHLYVNDVSDIFGLTDTSPAASVDYTSGNFGVGGTAAGSNLLNGDLARIWFSTEYIDFSAEANRRKFIAADGGAESLGPDGSLPTGNQPVLYLEGPAADFHLNRGSGGDFTVTGTLTDAATDPPCAGAEPEGHAAGTGVASGVGESTAASVGNAAGAGAAVAVGTTADNIVEAVGAAAGTGTAAGVGAAIATSIGAAIGTSDALAIGAAIWAAIGNAAGQGQAFGISDGAVPAEPPSTGGWGALPRRILLPDGTMLRPRNQAEYDRMMAEALAASDAEASAAVLAANLPKPVKPKMSPDEEQMLLLILAANC